MQFTKKGWETVYATWIQTTGNLSASAGNTELGHAIPPVAEFINASFYVSGTSCTSLRTELYSGNSGTNKTHGLGSTYTSSGTWAKGQVLSVAISAVTTLRNTFQKNTGSWVASDVGNIANSAIIMLLK